MSDQQTIIREIFADLPKGERYERSTIFGMYCAEMARRGEKALSARAFWPQFRAVYPVAHIPMRKGKDVVRGIAFMYQLKKGKEQK